MSRRAEVFHRPVLTDEVLEYLRPEGGRIVDACVGGGGHARAILGVLGEGRLLGLDADPEAIASAQRQLRDQANVELVHASYVEMASVVRRLGFGPVTGILFDLGVSLHQLRSRHRGFGFDTDGPIDMRFDQSASLPPASVLLRRVSLPQLTSWLRDYGQEPFATRIARRISTQRGRLKTTRDLVGVVIGCVPARKARKTLARVFQALRIATNRELDNVQAGLSAALQLLAPGGRIVVIAYHSLEDRLAKVAFRTAARNGTVAVLTPKPVLPSAEEIRGNPQARSARLRAVEKAR